MRARSVVTDSTARRRCITHCASLLHERRAAKSPKAQNRGRDERQGEEFGGD